MNSKVEINSLTVGKLKNDHSAFIKYDVEISIDEVENTETEVKLKYKFTLMSNPTNTKINVEGLASIYGNQADLAKHLESNEKNVPNVVSMIYQEIFPFFYVISKTMQIPCPAYSLLQMTSSPKSEAKTSPESAKFEEPTDMNEGTEVTKNHEIIVDKEITAEEQSQEQVIETTV